VTRPLSALVAGGGIDGLAAAVALRRAGFRATVVERAGSLREIGAGLALWPNAHQALAALGLAEEVERLGAPMDRTTILRSDGRVLGWGSIDMRRTFGAPGVCVRRSACCSRAASLAGPLRDAMLRLPSSWAARAQRWVYDYDPASA
jgi:2-polyprenyl-6-methoxyphenol hydroxylase-like FAD-dependent oxidoreductase